MARIGKISQDWPVSAQLADLQMANMAEGAIAELLLGKSRDDG